METSLKISKISLTIGLLLVGSVVLSGCKLTLLKRRISEKPPQIAQCDPEQTVCVQVQTPTEDTMRPVYRAKSPPSGPGLVVGVEAAVLDQTTKLEKEQALSVSAQPADKEIGKTIAALGVVSEQGFWLKTALVVVKTEGRVVWAANGNSVNVTLIPKPGAETSGSQISLAAMRALGIPLTALTELIVFQ
jgi:hypothetical protein